MDNTQSSTFAGARACASCGAAATTPEARFCLSCGKPLSAPVAASPAQHAEEPRAVATSIGVTTAPDPRADAPRRSPANALHCPACGEYVILDAGKCPMCDAQVDQSGSRSAAQTSAPNRGGAWNSAAPSGLYTPKQCQFCLAMNEAYAQNCRHCGRSLSLVRPLAAAERPVGAHWVSLIAGAAAMLGAVLPWYSYSDNATGASASFNGFYLGGLAPISYSWYPMIIGGVIVVLEWVALAGGKAGRGHWAAAMALAGVMAAALATDLQLLVTLTGSQPSTSVSIGPYLALIAAIVIGIVAVTGLVGEE